MTREECKKLLPAIQHFANGGDLWYYDGKKWGVQSELYLNHSDEVANLIEDKHFEARKSFALGEEVEYFNSTMEEWYLVPSDHEWLNDYEYRPKPSEPVYEWQWLYKKYGHEEFSITKHLTEEYIIMHRYLAGYTKFEPSKRIRK